MEGFEENGSPSLLVRMMTAVGFVVFCLAPAGLALVPQAARSPVPVPPVVPQSIVFGR